MKSIAHKLIGAITGPLAWIALRLASGALDRQASKIRQSSLNLQNAISILRSDRREIMLPTLECAKQIVVEYDDLAIIVEEMSRSDLRNLDFGKRLPVLQAKADKIEELRSHMHHVNEAFSRKIFDDAPSGSSKIIKPPGALLLALTRIVFAPKACRRVFEPIVADMRSEYFAALSKGKRNDARIALLRGWIALIRALGSKVLLLIGIPFRLRD